MEEYTRSRFALDLDACSENILTFREIPYVSSYAKKKNEMSLAMAIAWKEVLLSSCLSKSIHFSHSRVNVRYNFLSTPKDIARVRYRRRILRINLIRVSANDPLKKLAKVEQLIARSWIGHLIPRM